MVVRMNNASNMMMNWNQYFIVCCSPVPMCEKMCAMPTPSEIAPPGRPATSSPTNRLNSGKSCTGIPSFANTAAGELIAK